MVRKSLQNTTDNVDDGRVVLKYHSSIRIIWWSSIVCVLLSIGIVYYQRYFTIDVHAPIRNDVTTIVHSFWMIAYWSLAQWLPYRIHDGNYMNEIAWKVWRRFPTNYEGNKTMLIEIPVVHIQDHTLDELVPYIESKYGKDWRRRPLLLKGLWKMDEIMTTNSDLTNNVTDTTNLTTPLIQRRLSLRGLLQENLTIPYYTDARKDGAITPDAMGSVQSIVANIAFHDAPYKIGTQLFIQTYPELIEEVAPIPIVTKLFGSYFTPQAIRGSGPFNIFPALTTVPIFVANSNPPSTNDPNKKKQSQPPHTALHCEPIGNIAVQLSGQKLWTLVGPEYSLMLQPYIAPDGRAFFASALPISNVVTNDNHNIPYYQTTTEAGDAIWVPTWTWHRVDYVVSTSSVSTSSTTASISNKTAIGMIANKDMVANEQQQSSTIAIGASLFHFRPIDFIRNNPLHAILILPAIVLELIGYNTQ
jgi:hypothetical protein